MFVVSVFAYRETVRRMVGVYAQRERDRKESRQREKERDRRRKKEEMGVGDECGYPCERHGGIVVVVVGGSI